MVNIEKYKSGIVAKLKCDNTKAEAILKEAELRLNSFPNLTDEDKEKRFEKIITLMLRKRLSSKAEQFEGVILFESDARKDNENYINKILEEFKKDPIRKAKLLETGEVKEVGGKLIVFDMKEKFKSGLKNWNYKKPLIVQDRKSISGIVKDPKKKDEFVKMNISLSGADVTKTIKIGKVCKFFANEGKPMDDGTKTFYFDEGSDIEYSDKEVNVKDLLKNFYKDNFISLDKLQTTYEAMDSENRNYKLFIVEGELINDNSQTGNPGIVLSPATAFEDLIKATDEPVSVRIKLNPTLASTFDAERGSNILVAGTCWEMIKEEKTIFGMTAKMVYYTEKKIETKSLEGLSEEY